jgi:aminoglycoside/choline kinase family phosphotransferase
VSDRQQRISRLLTALGWVNATRHALAGDASSRRYERLIAADGSRAILMDSPNPQEDVLAFVAVGDLLRDLGLSVPTLLGGAPADGLLLLEDYGDNTFARLLGDGEDRAALYALATDALIALHTRFNPDVAAARRLPRYDAALFLDQVMLFADVYVPAALGQALDGTRRRSLEQAWREVLRPAVAMPWSLLHRDFHIDNLMHLAERPGVRACGILDFQSAGIGPVCYDLVSLLEDARRDVPTDLAADMTARYLSAFPTIDIERFTTGSAVIGAVRHASSSHFGGLIR